MYGRPKIEPFPVRNKMVRSHALWVLLPFEDDATIRSAIDLIGPERILATDGQILSTHVSFSSTPIYRPKTIVAPLEFWAGCCTQYIRPYEIETLQFL